MSDYAELFDEDDGHGNAFDVALRDDFFIGNDDDDEDD